MALLYVHTRVLRSSPFLFPVLGPKKYSHYHQHLKQMCIKMARGQNMAHKAKNFVHLALAFIEACQKDHF